MPALCAALGSARVSVCAHLSLMFTTQYISQRKLFMYKDIVK